MMHRAVQVRIEQSRRARSANVDQLPKAPELKVKTAQNKEEINLEGNSDNDFDKEVAVSSDSEKEKKASALAAAVTDGLFAQNKEEEEPKEADTPSTEPLNPEELEKVEKE